MNLLKIVLLVVISSTTALKAQTVKGRAEVTAVNGKATYSTIRTKERPLRADTVLPEGATIKTSADSTVDLFLGRSTGTLRVGENSALGLNGLKITHSAAGVLVDIQLELPKGSLIGDASHLPPGSTYEIKTPTGIVGVRGARYKCSAYSFLFVLEGELAFVHVTPGREMTPYVLTGPPAAYFTQFDGVRPAPPDLVAAYEAESAEYVERRVFPSDSRDNLSRLVKEPGTFTKR